MNIDFRCTKCGKLLRTGIETAGQRAKCPDCGTIMTIPAPGQPMHAAPAGPMPPDAPPMGPPPQAPGVSPYQSPYAAGPTSPYGGAVGVPQKLDMNDLFATAWAVFKPNLGMAIILPLVIELILFVAAAVLMVIVRAVFSASALLGVLFYLFGLVAFVALAAALSVGLWKAYLKLARGQPVAFGELFAFGPELGPFILTNLLLSAILSVGFACCIVPGYFFATMFSQCLFLVLDRNVGVLDSFTQSKDLTNGNKMTIFLTFFLASLAAPFVILLTCGIGFLFVPPFLMFLAVVTYLRITGQPIAVPAL